MKATGYDRGMDRSVVIAIVLASGAALPGCYYTATDRDGSTKRISASEYDKLRKQPRADTDPILGPVEPFRPTEAEATRR